MHAFKTGLSFTFHYDKLYVAPPFAVQENVQPVSRWRKKNPVIAVGSKFRSLLLGTRFKVTALGEGEFSVMSLVRPVPVAERSKA